jgi:hypothetical protein
MPTRVSIITNLLVKPAEPAKAMAVRAAVAALCIGLGPLAGGLPQPFHCRPVFVVSTGGTGGADRRSSRHPGITRHLRVAS